MTQSSGEFSKEQQAVLHENTVVSIISGLAVRYHNEYRRVADSWDRVGKRSQEQDDPLAEDYIERAKQYHAGLTAETPLVFSVEPSNLAVSVLVNKVSPHDGQLVDGSNYQIGLIGGLAGKGRPSKPFTDEDLQLAVGRLRKQKHAGLVYGLHDTSGFIEDY